MLLTQGEADRQACTAWFQPMFGYIATVCKGLALRLMGHSQGYA